MYKIFLFLLLFFLFIHCNAQHVNVIGAGNNEANGVYNYAGDFNGFSKWEKNNFSIYFSYQIGCTPKWVIMNLDTMIYKNYQYSSYDSLPPITEWQTTCYSGSIFPAPEVLSDYPAVFWNNLQYFHEATENNGSISDQYKMQIVMKSINNHVFNGEINEDFISSGKASSQNVPEGLIMKLIKKNDTLLELSFEGNALFHKASNSLYNISCHLKDNATTIFDSAAVISNSINGIGITFHQPVLFSSNMHFYESDSDDGTINNSNNRYIKLNRFGNETFSGEIDEDFYQSGKAIFSNMPAGLIPELILINDTALLITISGAALNHDYTDDNFNVLLNFTNNTFSGNNIDEILGQPVHLYFDFFGTIGTNENIYDLKFDLYPNPAHSIISIDPHNKNIDRIEIFNQKGEKYFSADEVIPSMKIDISKFPKSLYFIKIITNNNIIIKKVLIQ